MCVGVKALHSHPLTNADAQHACSKTPVRPAAITDLANGLTDVEARAYTCYGSQLSKGGFMRYLMVWVAW